MGWEAQVETISQSLRKEIIDSKDEPDLEKSQDLLQALTTSDKQKMTIAVLQKTRIGNTLTKCVKTLKRHKRTSTQKEELDSLIQSGESLLASWKKIAEEQAKKKKTEKDKDTTTTNSNEAGLPTTVKEYHTRLSQQRKDLYKDPPMLPPDHIDIQDEYCPSPTRNKKTGELTFLASNGSDGDDDAALASALKDFHPNRTPEEILRAGAFGGTYFRPIVSAVTNIRYKASDVLKDTVQPEWIKGLDAASLLTSATYRPKVNKFQVKCGGSLGMWESSGWIADCDPYGWFQWYCRFYQGRRCSDDVRQISRWAKSAGPKGRFRSQLCNKILRANTTADDVAISPVIRQTLLHWGLEITEDVLAKHKKRVG